MTSLLSRLGNFQKDKLIEPREIFMSLPSKDKQYEYPRDVQSEVWKKWFERRDDNNTIIKMNTGGGKTVVGLMILQSCLNEDKGPAIYAVPDKYLVNQVCKEADLLGIKTTTNKDDYFYSDSKSILVVPIHTIFNGKSSFGVNSTYRIGSILIDDVHACMDTIISQFSIKIPANHSLYSDIKNLLSSSLKQYDQSSYMSIFEHNDPIKNFLVPFWIWKDKLEVITRLLYSYKNTNDENKFVFFNLPLIENYLHLCNCTITSNTIEIKPKGIPISEIKSFFNANRRIFMSATLSDDSVFTSTLGLKKEDICDIITPEKANDLGDRLIIFPKHLNNSITDEEIKRKIIDISNKYNVVVIVPSFEKALFWDPDESITVLKENINNAVEDLKKGHVGLKIFVNRYDGIDLPDDACRLLVIDELPPLNSIYDKYVESIDTSSTIFIREQAQRIEQGMGRGVRSNNDSCAIVLIGEKLSTSLIRNKGIEYFSNATLAQYNLSKELWDLLKQDKHNPNINDIFELVDFSLNREVEWIKQSKDRLSAIKYNTEPNFNYVATNLRLAFESMIIKNYVQAIEHIDDLVNSEKNNNTKGYLLQIKAEYMDFIDRTKSQQILLSAKKYNKSTLSPIDGIQYDKNINSTKQPINIINYIDGLKLTQNEYLVHVESILSKLYFSNNPQNVRNFEQAINDISPVLGFSSIKKEHEGGSDSIWELGAFNYLIIECKSGSDRDEVSKDDCNQLGGSIRWFEKEYPPECKKTPILIHKSTTLNNLATAVHDMKIMDENCLIKFKKNINDLVTAIVRPENWNNHDSIVKLLKTYNLRESDIVIKYTNSYKQK